ncbi:ImmA/IrrE family metallo-endopeptidase [Clostridium gasigenes]|uniref:IrrE N-terminal-like domain-containing protein n=1 Tax=Clostridium gasigenes TaxID=94869 RepID=A0A1H0M4U1_9CLOT|nr:ImmA/IrrE family metallo-endopeptidase [Clostridium gasigenes]SDO75443.1 protein of unknown function [Clostridium gasigenes]
MTKYETLIAVATNQGAVVLEVDLGTDKACGKCIDNMLIINSRINQNEKYCVLAEELGHFHKTHGNITNQKKIDNVKQEIIARQWSYRELVGIMDIIKAFEHGSRDRFEMSEFLNITEIFLEEALNYYKSKYGLSCEIDNYIIYFEPYLGILKMY